MENGGYRAERLAVQAGSASVVSALDRCRIQGQAELKKLQNEILGEGQNAKGTDSISLDEYHKLTRKRSKYNARKTVVDGITFASKAESARYRDLKILQELGVIRGLQTQPRYELLPAFTDCQGKHHRKIEYVADFAYVEVVNNKLITEDCKGVETQVFRIKMKLFLYKYSHVLEFRIVCG